MKRLLAMSDIHGNLNKFEKMIDKVNLTKEDRLVIMGDNVDRGKHSIELIFRIKELKDEGYDIITLMGNHEDMLIYFIEQYKSVEALLYGKDGASAVHNGTANTFDNYMKLSNNDKELFLNEIKSYRSHYELLDYLFVHAGVMPETPLEWQDIDDMLWIRKGFVDKVSHGLPYTVIFGHTPTSNLNENNEFKVWRMNDKIGIDCGASSIGGSLACLDVLNNIEYYVWKY